MGRGAMEQGVGAICKITGRYWGFGFPGGLWKLIAVVAYNGRDRQAQTKVVRFVFEKLRKLKGNKIGDQESNPGLMGEDHGHPTE